MFRLISYVPSAGKLCSTTQAVARAERQAVDVRACAGRARSDIRRASARRAFSPTARMLMSRAAATYCSMCVGDTRSTSATLSKPSLAMSAGSIERASMCTPSSSSTAVAYSVRFMRCSATRPGSGPRAAAVCVEIALERRDERVPRLRHRGAARRAAASGRRAACERPARRLRACAATSAAVTRSSDSSPAASASLWQSVQNGRTVPTCCATACSGGGSRAAASDTRQRDAAVRRRARAYGIRASH